MNLLKSSKRRSLLSEIIYNALNIALAVVILIVVIATASPLPAFAVFLLSKWRMLAVRPRYWLANIKANLVDSIVGLGFVVFLYVASGALTVQIVLTTLYIGWLLYVKPKSKRSFVAIQAGTAVFVGVTALMAMTYNWHASGVVLAMWIIGYSAARHVLSSYDEAHRSFFNVLWAFVFAELGWLAYHWTFAYTVPGFGGLKLTQAAIVALALSFLAERVYASYHHHEGVRSGDVILPALLTVSVVVVVMLFFNTLDRGVV